MFLFTLDNMYEMRGEECECDITQEEEEYEIKGELNKGCTRTIIIPKTTLIHLRFAGTTDEDTQTLKVSFELERSVFQLRRML